MARTCALGRGTHPAALGPPPDRLEVHSPTCSSADPAPTPASAHKPRKPHTPGLGALSCLEPDHERRVAQRHRRSPVWHGPKSALHACRLVMPRVAPVSPSWDSHLRHHRHRGRDGRQSEWYPSGHKASLTPGARAVTLLLLTGLWSHHLNPWKTASG